MYPSHALDLVLALEPLMFNPVSNSLILTARYRQLPGISTIRYHRYPASDARNISSEPLIANRCPDPQGCCTYVDIAHVQTYVVTYVQTSGQPRSLLSLDAYQFFIPFDTAIARNHHDLYLGLALPIFPPSP